jgi:hypothetical protein
LIEVHREQLASTDLKVAISLAEIDRQDPYLSAARTFAGTAAHHHATAFEQAVEQPTGLPLSAAQQIVAGAQTDRAQIDIVAPGLPGSGSGQQRRRAAAQHRRGRSQVKSRLLAGTAHERTTAKASDGLGQAALELIAVDGPGGIFHACLESEGHGRQAGDCRE